MTTIEFSQVGVQAAVDTGAVGEQARGWAVSLLLHGMAVAGAVLFMAEIDKPILLEAFHWDVSMVEAPTRSESPPAEPVVQPPPPPVKPNPPVRPTPKPIAQQPQPMTHAEPVMEYAPVESAEHQVVTSEAPVAQPVEAVTAQIVEQASPVESPGPALEHRMVQYLPVQYRRTQADYGWLRDLLWKRIEELKRYPAQAKFNHWEGKVVVQAVIKADGTVGDVRVAESSGHALLDEEALVVMRKASPLTLKHQLEKSQITILVPISYRLDG
jgi:protein TonB